MAATLIVTTSLGAFQTAAMGIMAATQLPPRAVVIRTLGNLGGMFASWLSLTPAVVLLLNEAGVWAVTRLSGSYRIPFRMALLANACRLSCILTWLRMVRSARKPAEKAVQAFVAKFEGTKQAEMITAPSPASLEFVAETTFPVRIPWNLTHIKNITYVTPAELEQAGGEKAQRFLQLDIIRKQTGYKGRPILLNIHGGAWKAVDKSARMARYWTLASKENWVIVNINYRLAPSVNLFEMIGDCKKALRWVRQNPHIHGGDTTFVAVSGESAGGHLATLVAFTQNDPSFQRGWEQVDTSIQACIPVYGVMEPLGPLAVHPLAKGLRGFFSNEIVRMTDTESRAATGRPAIEWADPMGVLQAIPLEARGKLPPTFIIHGDVDTLVLVEHSRKFYEELKRGDAVAAGYLEVPGAHHAFDVYHSPLVLYETWAIGWALEAMYAAATKKQ